MKRLLGGAVVAAGMLQGSVLFGAETVTYTYDARGRVIRVVKQGPVNNNVTTEITRDRANNRTRVKVTGANK